MSFRQSLARRVLCRVVGLRAEGRGQRAEGRGQRAEEEDDMRTDLRGEFIKLVSTVVGLSVGVGVMTATVLLGAAALLQ